MFTGARANMAMASSMGALAFQKGLGVTHSLSHQLSAEYGVHHDLANAILLPHTMAFNLGVAEDKLTRISFDKYLVFYVVKTNTIQIRRVIHVARQYNFLL